jgi:transposase
MAKKIAIQSVPSEFAACIGIDWGDKEHSVCLQVAGSQKVERWKVKHTPEELDAWLLGLLTRFEGRPVAVCLELARGPIVSVLLRYDFVTVFPVNPQTLARYREAWAPSGAKDDPSDAKLALEVLQTHRDKLSPLRPQSAEMRALQRLVEDRRRIVEQRVRHTNRLTSALKEYFPQVLQWFDEKGTLVFCEFLKRWDTPEAARRARAATVEAFLRDHNVRYAARIEERIAAMKACLPLTTDKGVVLPAQQMVRALLPQLIAAIEAIRDYDKLITELESKLSSHRIFRSFPAAADVFAPRLLAVFGEDRERFRSAAEVQRYCGVAPVTERSGKQNWIHWRYRCSKFQRQTLVEWAGLSIPHSYWAEQFYKQHRARGAGHQAALRALAFKWVRILFRCWQAGELYDESRYLKALHKRGASLLLGPEKSTAQA